MNILEVIDEKKLFEILNRTRNPRDSEILAVLEKAKAKRGLDLEEVGILLNAEKPELLEKIFQIAGWIKEEIYGERLVLFAPLYISDFCVNDCDYCGFHRRNKVPRRKLTLREIESEVKILERMGHKRILLEAGEDPTHNPIDYIADAIKTIYNTKEGRGEIRRVNVNIAATSCENYKKLKGVGIGTYQLFQETYHRSTYKGLHKGPKADYLRQLTAHQRAFEAGIDDLGFGVLFGLYDWKFDVLALIAHAQYFDKEYGVGPHTFSVPRLQPVDTVDLDKFNLVSDRDFLKIIAVLRIAVPYTGMIISTRESPLLRARAFQIGISQTSAASRTSPGGYGINAELSQFSLSDKRSLNEVIDSILEMNLVPSFCTACYRVGRTGKRFMAQAKSGKIQNFCRPNALLTLMEYLQDYASGATKEKGEVVIRKYIGQIPNQKIRKKTERKIELIKNGRRDLYF